MERRSDLSSQEPSLPHTSPTTTIGHHGLAILSTHVHYDPADPISHACAYLALVPQALVITYVALIWSTREVEILLMFAGQMGCEAVNWLLKRTIKEQRPPRAYIAFIFTVTFTPLL